MSSPVSPAVAAPLPALTRRGVVVLLLVFTAIWFSNLDYRRLVHPDEGRYAEIPREMAASGDWVTPRLNGIKYFEKPPLLYWANAASLRLFGLTPWAARLPTRLFGLGTVAALVLGVAGKMGPTLARMAKRASDAAGVRRRVIGVSRFSAGGQI